MDFRTALHRLDEERQRLLAQIDEETPPNGSVTNGASDQAAQIEHAGDPTDVATQTLERAYELSMRQRLADRLEAIEQAITRLREGTYGTCETCRSPISEERLEFRPDTRYCRDHQAEMERTAATRRRARLEGATIWGE